MKHKLLVLVTAALCAGVVTGATSRVAAGAYHGKEVKVTITMSSADANGRMHTVVRVQYKNLTDQPLKLESGLNGFIDPRSKTNPQNALHMDPWPAVLASSPRLRLHADAGTTWKSVLGPHESMTYRFTVQAIGQRTYCLEDVVTEAPADPKDLLGPIAGVGVGCADIVDHQLVYPAAQVQSFKVKFGVPYSGFLPKKKADWVQLRLHNPGPGNYLTVTFLMTSKGKPYQPEAASFTKFVSDMYTLSKSKSRAYLTIPVHKTRIINFYSWPGADHICVKSAGDWLCQDK